MLKFSKEFLLVIGIAKAANLEDRNNATAPITIRMWRDQQSSVEHVSSSSSSSPGNRFSHLQFNGQVEIYSRLQYRSVVCHHLTRVTTENIVDRDRTHKGVQRTNHGRSKQKRVGRYTYRSHWLSFVGDYK